MPETSQTVFARRLRQERIAKGIAQSELARRMSARLGSAIDGSAITRVEKGERSVKLEEAVAAADILAVPLASLVTDKSPEEARIDELHRELGLQQERSDAAEAEFRQAQAAMAAIEQELGLLESGGD